jgi:Mg/Co/Ni transporter MgtE
MAPVDAIRAARSVVGDFVRRYPDEAARAIERLPDVTSGRWLPSVPDAQVVRVLERLTPEVGARTLSRMADDTAGAALAKIEPGRATSLLEWFDQPERERYLQLVDDRTARELRAIAAFPEDSAGRLMDPRVTILREEATAREALARLRSGRHRADGEIFVVDFHTVGSPASRQRRTRPRRRSRSHWVGWRDRAQACWPWRHGPRSWNAWPVRPPPACRWSTSTDDCWA